MRVTSTTAQNIMPNEALIQDSLLYIRMLLLLLLQTKVTYNGTAISNQLPS